MKISIDQESPRIIRADVSGRMDVNGWRAALREIAGLLTPGEVTPLLVWAVNFEGWGPGTWDDFSFQQQHDVEIGRMAIVGDRKWEDRALMFAGKGLRGLEIEFFTPDDVWQARRWLSTASSPHNGQI